MQNSIQIMTETGIIPVVAIEDASLAVPMADALMRGGLPVAEITFRTDAAAAAMRNIRAAVPDMLICAGTVRSVRQAELAVENGARAIISPGTDNAVVSWCIKNGIDVFPGCITPTEIENASAMGLDVLKFFPAEAAGGIKMLKALYGPYSGIRFMPTGGISLQNAAQYLTLPNVIACGGSWICSTGLLRARDYAAIEKNAAECAQLVRNVRENRDA